MIFWFAIVFVAFVRGRMRWGPRASGWYAVVPSIPLLGPMLLALPWGGEMLPNFVAYRADASWWTQHRCDVLYGTVVVGVTAVMLVLSSPRNSSTIASSDG